VAQNTSFFNLGNVALEDVQVGAADGGGINASNHISGFKDGRIRNFLPRPLACAVVNNCLHNDSFVEFYGGGAAVIMSSPLL